jgi:peptidyl-prolyl cis-trans isomerase SurA
VALLLPCGAGAQGGVQPLDSIVAVVNNDVIVRSELNSAIDMVIPELQARGTAIPPQDVLEKQVLERLILKRLQLQQAASAGIEVDDATLNEAMTSIASRNGMSLEQLRETLEAGGVPFEDFRKDTREQILTTRLQQQEVLQRINVSDAEVDRFLKQQGDSLIERREVRLQHILVALPDNPSEAQVAAARAKAGKLLAQIRGGASFADVAASNSDGRRALEGGDLGWFPMAEVPTLAMEPARTLAKGEVSEPIQSPSGFHLIRVADIKGDAPEPVAQTHARHILIRTNEVVSDEDAQRRLSQLRLRITGGDDFATLARAHSDDTGSALKGGDLGWVNPGDTVPEFEEQMNKLAPNEISQPFKSPFGWHILQVLERRQQETADALMRMKAEEAIRQRKGEEATEVWLRQLRDEAYVDLRVDTDY